MPTFRDHFSGHAREYRRWRPSYPGELFEWLAGLVERHQRAWDCATGNGQAALGLAPFFERVVATDASFAQLASAVEHPRVAYHAAESGASALAPASVDLMTVAQALHWFDLEPFERELFRVVRPGGVVAAWTYPLFRVEPAVDALVEEFVELTVGAFWPPERRHVDAGYATLELDLEPIEPPEFVMRSTWDLEALLAYVGTWSAVARFRAARGLDPIPDLAATLEAVWGPPGRRRQVRWRLPMLVGRVRGGERRG